MAQPKFQPVLGETKTPTYIRPGVVDSSSAKLISGIGSMIPSAVEGYGNYKAGQVLDTVDKDLQTYESGLQAEAENLGIRKEVSNLWDNYEEVDDQQKIGVVNVLEKNFEANLQKIKAAEQQGLMSTAEVQGRITKITREAIMKNPWLEQEIYGKVQNYLKTSGIADVLKYREDSAADAAKQAQQEYETFRNRALTLNLPVTPGMPLERIVEMLGVEQKRLKTLEVAKGVLEQKIALSETQVMNLLDSGDFQKGYQTYVDDLQQQYIGMISEAGTATDYSNAVTAIDASVVGELSKLKARLGGAILTPNGKALYQEKEKELQEVARIAKEAGSGKVAKEWMQARFETKKADRELDLYTRFNVPEIDMKARLLPGMTQSMRDSMFAAGGARAEAFAKDFMNVMFPENAGTKEHVKSLIGGAGNNLLQDILNKKETLSASDDSRALDMIVRNTNKAILSGSIPVKEARTTLNGLLSTVAQNAAAIKAKPISPEFSREVTTAVSTAMGEIVPELFKSIDTVINNPKSAKGDKIILDVLPNGAFKVETNNPEANRKFNEKFSNQINNALDSYAVANGMSREKAAPLFYQQYFGELLQGDKDLDALQGATGDLNNTVEPTLPTPPVEPPVANPSALQRVIPDGKPLPPTILDRNLDSVEKKFPQWENPTIDNIKEEAATAWEKVNRDFRSGKITSEQRLEEASRINKEMKQRIQDVDFTKDPVKYFKEEEKKMQEKGTDKGASLQGDDNLLQSIASAIEAINKPRTVLRDENGRITGVA